MKYNAEFGKCVSLAFLNLLCMFPPSCHDRNFAHCPFSHVKKPTRCWHLALSVFRCKGEIGEPTLMGLLERASAYPWIETDCLYWVH
jgi:hypothetical protein